MTSRNSATVSSSRSLRIPTKPTFNTVIDRSSTARFQYRPHCRIVSLTCGEQKSPRPEERNAVPDRRRARRWTRLAAAARISDLIAHGVSRRQHTVFDGYHHSPSCSHVRVQGYGRNYLFPQWREGAGSEERTAGDRTRRRRLNKLSCADWLPHDRGFVSGCLALRTSIGPRTGS